MKLSKAITAHGESVSEINFRAPTVEDITRIGFPFSADDDGGTTPNAKLVAQYIVRLAAIPLSSVNQLQPTDFMKATGEVLGFFGNSAEEAPES